MKGTHAAQAAVAPTYTNTFFTSDTTEGQALAQDRERPAGKV